MEKKGAINFVLFLEIGIGFYLLNENPHLLATHAHAHIEKWGNRVLFQKTEQKYSFCVNILFYKETKKFIKNLIFLVSG